MVGTPSLRRLRQSTSGPSTSEPSPSRQKHLHVTVVKALGLQLGDHHHSELGPYVSLRLKEDKWKTNNNRHDRKNENPEWNDSYTFRVENPLTDVLTLQVHTPQSPSPSPRHPRRRAFCLRRRGGARAHARMSVWRSIPPTRRCA